MTIGRYLKENCEKCKRHYGSYKQRCDAGDDLLVSYFGLEPLKETMAYIGSLNEPCRHKKEKDDV